MSYTNSTNLTSSHERGKHLNFEDRCSIRVCQKLGMSLRETAAIVCCAASTVLNELRRGTKEHKCNRGRKPEYSAKYGQKVYEEHRSKCHRRRKVDTENPFVVWLINMVRTKGWSLDACAGYARKNHLFPQKSILSTKTLYNTVWNGIILSPFDLPEALSRARKKRSTRKNKRIFGVSIEERPEIVCARTEFGHWEIDTVVGRRAGKASVVLTLVKKITDYYIAIKIPSKTSEAVLAAMEVLREEYGKEHFALVFKTITADNGSEFESLSALETSGVKVYFAHPYSSWERPQNERHNRIFRRYVPKGVSVDSFAAEQILVFADDMNALPRRNLDYATPEELFDAILDLIYSIHVA